MAQKSSCLKALALKPGLARANYFYARVLKDEGKYDEAETVLAMPCSLQYPRDRVVHNELGRILFLQKRYADAVKEFQRTLSIDPEDLQANYNLMLCYTGLGDEARANDHKERYLRFKADEVFASPHRRLPPGASRRQPRAPGHPRTHLGRSLPVLQAAQPSKSNASRGPKSFRNKIPSRRRPLAPMRLLFRATGVGALAPTFAMAEAGLKPLRN